MNMSKSFFKDNPSAQDTGATAADQVSTVLVTSQTVVLDLNIYIYVGQIFGHVTPDFEKKNMLGQLCNYL